MKDFDNNKTDGEPLEHFMQSAPFPYHVGEAVLFNEQECVIVGSAPYLLALEITTKYLALGDAKQITWVKTDWVKEVPHDPS